MATREIAWQSRREISYGVVHQSDQPADHLQRTPMETRTLPIRTLFVIGAGRRIQEGVMDTDAERLFFVLPCSEDRQQIFREPRTGRVQRMPAILLRAGSDLATDKGSHRLVGTLALE